MINKTARLGTGVLIVYLWLAVFSAGQPGQEQKPRLNAYPGFAGIIEAFQRSTIVALPDRHQDSNSSGFRIDLISQPGFSDAAQDIIIEWGNRLYQQTLDRYIAGENVSRDDLQKIWRNTTQLDGLWDSPGYAEFLRAVRVANSNLRTVRRMRVLAGDPPIDWEKVNNRNDYEKFAARRDESILSVIEDQVLPKHHKALLIMGGGHFRRGVAVDQQTGIVDLFERAHFPDKIFVVAVNPNLNQELSAYPDGSFFFTKGSWLEPMSSARGVLIYDAVLTLSEGVRARPDASTFKDPGYFRELDHRWRIVLGRPFTPEKLP